MTVKIGLYGGSFDPIHDGHIRPVRAAQRQLGLDRVIYLPTGRPPHKPGAPLLAAAVRYAMVELALLWEEGLVASTYELREDEPCYTIDTIDHFRRTAPDAEHVLLLGSDSYAELTTWRDWQRILAAVSIAVLVRPGWEMQGLRASLPTELATALDGPRVHLVDHARVDVSSTEIRRHLGTGHAAGGGRVPRLVLDYIRKYDLYASIPTAEEAVP